MAKMKERRVIWLRDEWLALCFVGLLCNFVQVGLVEI